MVFLAIDLSRVLKFPAIIVLLLFFLFMFVNTCFMYVGASALVSVCLKMSCPVVGVDHCAMHYLFFALKLVLSDTGIAAPAFISVCMDYLFPFLHFQSVLNVFRYEVDLL